MARVSPAQDAPLPRSAVPTINSSSSSSINSSINSSSSSVLSPRYHVLPGADTPWKDSERLAQFVANVVGGSVVVSAAASYAARAVAAALPETPPSAPALLRRALSSLSARLASAAADAWAAGAALLSQRPSLEELTADPRAAARPLAALTAALALALLARKYRSVGWFCGLQLLVMAQWLVALYQVARIALSLSLLLGLKAVKLGGAAARRAFAAVFRVRGRQIELLRRLMRAARSYAEWSQMARHLDALEGRADWAARVGREDLELCDFAQVERNMAVLRRLLAARPLDVEELQYVVAAHVMRNELGVDAPGLHLGAHSGTKRLLAEYNALVVAALDALAAAPPPPPPPGERAAGAKLRFFRRLQQSFGATALCLSGGGALAMYHMGVVRALLEADLLPNVVSGSSGGAITAAFLACRTREELLERVLVPDVATRYFPLGIRWFPPLLAQLAHCVKTGFLVESSVFERTTAHYYGEPMDAPDKSLYYTFADAFARTGRHVCITVSASEATGRQGPKKLLLSHVDTPHVLLWSAVAVSCSLPGIMKGKRLMARDFAGRVVPYSSMGKEWVDGSLQHDLPMETMASRFEVSNFIVSQVNPHVVPFVGDEVDRPAFRGSVFHTLESVVAGDVRHRLKVLALLGLFPKIYGHQFSAFLKQNFSGNVTLVPDFSFLEAVGVKAILNPTVDDMTRYIEGGQRTAWPKLAYIRHLSTIERCLNRHVARLRAEAAASPPTDRGVENWHARGAL